MLYTILTYISYNQQKKCSVGMEWTTYGMLITLFKLVSEVSYATTRFYNCSRIACKLRTYGGMWWLPWFGRHHLWKAIGLLREPQGFDMTLGDMMLCMFYADRVCNHQCVGFTIYKGEPSCARARTTINAKTGTDKNDTNKDRFWWNKPSKYFSKTGSTLDIYERCPD